MEKILLLVSHENNYKLLANLLSEYKVCGDKKHLDSADLVITDYNFLTYNWEKLAEFREASRHLLLPYLLMVSPAEKKLLKHSDLQIADEILEIPADKIMIQIRVESLLRLRKFSLESLQHNQLFQFMDRSVPAGICILQEGKIVYANQALCNLLEKDARELYRTFFLNFAHPDYKFKLQQAVEKAQRNDRSGHTYEIQIVTAVGKQRWAELRFSPIMYNNIPSLIASMSDLTERKLYEKKLQYMSLHDQLTGLYNRIFFTEEMHRLQKGRDFPITIIFADLNGLKFINDSMGHHKGDELLKVCAEVLENSLRSSDILARVGGDEFAVLLPNTNEQDGEKIMQRISDNVKAYNQENPELILSLAMGLATAETHKESLEKTLERADEAMYSNKFYKGEGRKGEDL